MGLAETWSFGLNLRTKYPLPRLQINIKCPIEMMLSMKLTSHLEGSNSFGAEKFSGSIWTALFQIKTFHPSGMV